MIDAKWEETWLWIKDKQGRLRPFVRNGLQRRYDVALEQAFEGKPNRFAIVIKARRGGISTRESSKNYRLAATESFQNAVVVAQEAEAAQEIFEIARLFDEMYRGPSRLGNKREIRFHNHSRLRVVSAGKTAPFRGATVQRAHLTEVPKWPSQVDLDEFMAGTLEAASHGEVIIETTTGGMGDWLHRTWEDARAGRNDWATVFLPWWFDDTLRVPLDEMAAATLEQGRTEEELALQAREGLSLEQLAWRRIKQRQLRHLFSQEYPEDPVSAFLSAGASFFHERRLQALIPRCLKPIEVRRHPEGVIRVWHPPEGGEAYSIGVDTSEGIEGGDYSCAAVLRDRDGEQVAELHGLFRGAKLAHLVAQLGHEYQDARIAIEREGPGHGVILALVEIERYPKGQIFRALKRGTHGRPVRVSRYGWTTNAETRSVLLGDLALAVEGQLQDDGTFEDPPPMKVNSPELLGEGLSFRLKRTGRYEAAAGSHDDRVFAWGIAWQQRQDRKRAPGLVV